MKVTSKCPQCGHGIEHFNGVYVGMLWRCPKCHKEWPVTKEEETTSQADESVTHTLGTANHYLRRAAEIMEERGKQYDQPEGERSMGKCVAAFNIVTGHTLTEAEGWLLLQILKDVRQWQRPGFHQDSADDCIAYAALKAEAKQKEALCNGR